MENQTIIVFGVIRKLPLGNEYPSNKTHVLYVQKDEQTRSFLVDQDIVKGSMTIDENLNSINESFKDIEIVLNANAVARNSNREFLREDTIGNLIDAADVPYTWTVDHAAIGYVANA